MHLGAADQQSQPARDTPARAPMWYEPDPTMVLRGPRRVKHLDITEFINMSAAYVDTTTAADPTAADVLDTIARARAGPKKPRLEDVTIPEWNIANVRIMDELHSTSADSFSVRNYWAYTVQINTLFKKHKDNAVRVMFYDRAYRMKQAEYGCPWGVALNWLLSEHFGEPDDVLSAKHQSSTGARPYEGKKTRQPPGSTGETCGLYNYRGCKFGSKCIHIHQCMICGGGHPKHACPSRYANSSPQSSFNQPGKGYSQNIQHNKQASPAQHNSRGPQAPQQQQSWYQPGSNNWNQPSAGSSAQQ